MSSLSNWALNESRHVPRSWCDGLTASGDVWCSSYLCDFLLVFQEHHLQRAISAQQVFREKKENMVIPVPEAESNTTYYDRLYKGEVKVPKQLIHIQREYMWDISWTWTRAPLHL